VGGRASFRVSMHLHFYTCIHSHARTHTLMNALAHAGKQAASAAGHSTCSTAGGGGALGPRPPCSWLDAHPQHGADVGVRDTVSARVWVGGGMQGPDQRSIDIGVHDTVSARAWVVVGDARPRSEPSGRGEA